MIKNLLFIAAILLLNASCSRSLYFASEENGIYSTIELTNKNEVVYRSKANTFAGFNSTNFSYTNKERSSGYIKMSPGWIIYQTGNDFRTCPTNAEVSYEIISADSLVLVCRYCADSILNEDKCFNSSGIEWFPVILKKTDKIDYSKFDLPDSMVPCVKKKMTRCL